MLFVIGQLWFINYCIITSLPIYQLQTIYRNNLWVASLVEVPLPCDTSHGLSQHQVKYLNTLCSTVWWRKTLEIIFFFFLLFLVWGSGWSLKRIKPPLQTFWVTAFDSICRHRAHYLQVQTQPLTPTPCHPPSYDGDKHLKKQISH